MYETRCVRFGDRVGELNAQVDDTPHVHHPSGHFRAKRLSFEILEDEIETTVVLPGLKYRRHVRMRQRCEGSRPLEQRAAIIGRIDKPGREQAHRHRAPEAGITRAIELARTSGVEALEQVVMTDDTDRRRHGNVHVRSGGSSGPPLPSTDDSMTLCNSSFASPMCSMTSAMSSVGLPGIR